MPPCPPSSRLLTKLLALAMLGLFTRVRGETAWKIRMGFTLRFYGSEKTGCKEPLSPLCDTKNTRSRLVQLFSKQFRKERSTNFALTEFSEVRIASAEHGRCPWAFRPRRLLKNVGQYLRRG